MAVILATPSPELAARILTRVAPDHVLAGVRMHAMAGNQRFLLHYFADATEFLCFNSAEDLDHRDAESTIGYIDPDVLRRWIEVAFKDEELVAAIEAATAGMTAYGLMVPPVQELMRQRLRQCEQVASAA